MTLNKGTRVRLRGYEGTVIATNSTDGLGYIPPSMVGVQMPGGATLAERRECEPLD